MYLLNLIHLRPGQAMYLPAGELHAYLEGTGVEVMANSNNVLRGGLTRKHIDPDELLHILTFASGPAEILEPVPDPANPDLTVYRTPAEEFDLARVHVTESHPYRAGSHHGVRLLLVTEGNLRVTTDDGEQQAFRSGQAFLIPQGVAYRIACSGEAVFYQAFVPGF
jgi:mannose-6-phosphate isomerase class I